MNETFQDATLTVADLLSAAADHIEQFGHCGPGPYTGAWYFYGCDGRDWRHSSASLPGAIRAAAGVPDELWDAPHAQQPQIVREATEFLASRTRSSETDPLVAVFELNAVIRSKALAVDALRLAAEAKRAAKAEAVNGGDAR